MIGYWTLAYVILRSGTTYIVGNSNRMNHDTKERMAWDDFMQGNAHPKAFRVGHC